MGSLRNTNISPREHIEKIFKSFNVSSRVLESFTNLSSTVIDTALSGQNKFIFEILQNADDSCRDQDKDITVQFTLEDKYFIIQHNGKEFDFYDVERICDYASQIKEVKARDLNKTGYKGLGFKTLFNLSNCIYICSGGYSFRFDKTSCRNPETTPWQVIPIWSDNLPLKDKYKYNYSVNFILSIRKAKQLEKLLSEIITQPQFFLYLHHVNKFCVNLAGKEHILERKVENFGTFAKCYLYMNQSVVSVWLSRTYRSSVPANVQNIIRKGSKYTYPDKIKEATDVSIIYTLKTEETCKEIVKINDGLCFNTLPTQLNLTLPYHINSFFILNLDRTQLDENDWNEYLIEQIGYFQIHLLKDLADVPHLKNFVVELLTRKINHPYNNFTRAFSRGLCQALKKLAWLPSQEGSRLLKLREAWIDDILFFKQNFVSITDEVSRNIIDYDVKCQHYLMPHEAKRFTYDQLLNSFANKYYPLLSDDSYMNFISYLYKRLGSYPSTSSIICKLRDVAFLRTKNGTLSSPKDTFLEEDDNPIPDFFELNPIDNKYLPLTDAQLVREWLIFLGVKQINTAALVLRESLMKWIDTDNLPSKITLKNHIGIINYLTENSGQLTKEETDKLKEHLLIFTKSKVFNLVKACYLPDALPIKELEDIIPDKEKISPMYNMGSLKAFLTNQNIRKKITPIRLLQISILEWIKNHEIQHKLKTSNYIPIIEYFASQYPKIEDKLTELEKSQMRKMPVLTCAQVFQKAEACFFDSALPDIPGFECVIPEDILVCTTNISKKVCEFLAKIGVSEEIEPEKLIRKSVLDWIQKGIIQSKINLNNHQSILKYIADKWGILSLSGLNKNEFNYFYKFPILTKSNTFKEASHCYWQIDITETCEKIPHIETIISSSDFVSSEYKLPEIKNILDAFGVRSLKFHNICEKYCEHLMYPENIKWFFSHLLQYWENNKHSAYTDTLLTCIKKKLSTSNLLAKNSDVYRPAELYSYRFFSIHSIDPISLPLLDFVDMPEDLEVFLGFKNEIKMPCMVKLLDAFGKKQENKIINEKKTLAFFKMLLEQLKCKNRNEIKRYTLKLLSEANALTPAKDLYYFQEEDSKCSLCEYYLKRICGMSHEETLKLAELCGVNILPFHIDSTFKEPKPKSTLKNFYLERLPFIVLKESKKRNDRPSVILKNLFNAVCLINLFECKEIYIQYPFGESVKERHYFEYSNLYVIDDWRDYSFHIHEHVKTYLCIEANIDYITNMRSVSQKKKDEWLQYEKEDAEVFYQIEKEIQSLLSDQEENLSEIFKDCSASNNETVCEISKTTSTKNIDDDGKNSRNSVSMRNGVSGGYPEPQTKMERTQNDNVNNVRSNDKYVIKNDQNLKESRKSSTNISTETIDDEQLSWNPGLYRNGVSLSYRESQTNEIEGTWNDNRNNVISIDKLNCDDNILNLNEFPTKLKNSSINQDAVPVSLAGNIPAEPISVLPGFKMDKSRAQKSSESYVFTFLQDYYKNKYPEATYTLFNGYFTLKWLSHKFDIIWLNESGDKELPYDLTLKKNGEVKQIIEVQSINKATDDFFNVNHRIFLKKNQLKVKEEMQKYSIYCVFNIKDSSVVTIGQVNRHPILYKIVPLKIP